MYVKWMLNVIHKCGYIILVLNTNDLVKMQCATTVLNTVF